MTICTNDGALLTLELPSGEVFSGVVGDFTIGHETSLSLTDGDGYGTSEMLKLNTGWSFSGTGAGVLSIDLRNEYEHKIAAQMVAPEWKCPYCGTVNEKSQTYCGAETTHGCGASRPMGLVV